MSMAIIGVAGTVIGAGASIYGTMSANKAAKGGVSASGLNVGQKPKAAEYKPVNFTDEQLNTIQGNLDNLKKTDQLTWSTNNILNREAMRRATKFIPGYKQNIQMQGNITNSLLQGNLPYDDVLGIIAKRGAAANMVGTPGGSAPATMRDLGLSRLDAMKTGAGMLSGMVDIAERINPVSRQMLPQSMYLNPLDRIKMSMEQNQLIQQSDQNKYNIEAAPTPSEALQAQVALGNRASGGGGGADVGGYAQALQGLIGGIGQIANRGSTPGGTYVGQFAQNPNPAVQNRIYRPATSIAV